MANSVIVVDDEYSQAAKTLQDYGRTLSIRLETYCKCLERVARNAIEDDLVSSKLAQLAQRAAELDEPLRETVNEVSGMCSAYVMAIDVADRFLG